MSQILTNDEFKKKIQMLTYSKTYPSIIQTPKSPLYSTWHVVANLLLPVN